MKTRDVRRLRKQVANFKSYDVSYSFGLFGDFDNGGLCCHTIMASNPIMAVEKYMRWYFRRNKERNIMHTTNPVETSRRWGKFLVIDSKGYKRYFM